MITDRDILILVALVRYYVLNRAADSAVGISHAIPTAGLPAAGLQVLVDEHLINRQNILFCHPSATPAPVYFPARKAASCSPSILKMPHYLVTPTAPPIPHHAFHWLAVSDTHIAFDEAVEHASRGAGSNGWINEWDVVNKDESRPEKRFQLYTLLQEHPRLVCVPDAAFLMSFKGASKVFYLEQDRATSGAQQIANSKTAGYAAMAEKAAPPAAFSRGDARPVLGAHGCAEPETPRQPAARHSRKAGRGACGVLPPPGSYARRSCSMSPSTTRATATSPSRF